MAIMAMCLIRISYTRLLRHVAHPKEDVCEWIGPGSPKLALTDLRRGGFMSYDGVLFCFVLLEARILGPTCKLPQEFCGCTIYASMLQRVSPNDTNAH
jgi:hypothetical protein